MGLIKSALFGLLLVIAACVLLFWAEGRAVKTARALEEGSGLVVSVDAGSIDPANEGQLVHISGSVVPQGTPADERLGIAADGAVTLARQVEMYQWKELSREVERTGSDGKKTKQTVYDYEKVWSNSEIDSNKFKMASAPKNPAMPLPGDSFRVAEVKIGSFRLSGKSVSSLATSSALKLSDDGTAGIATAVGAGAPVWLIGNQYVVSNDPDKPEIGDIRIGYVRGDLDRASVAGAQKGDQLVPYVTSNGREIFLTQRGNATADEMFKDAIANNKVLTWVIRIGGLLLMLFGFSLSFSPLTGTLGQIPVVGGLVRGGAFLFGLAMTLALGSIVIAAGWIFYRPLLALAIAAIGIGVAFATGLIGNRRATTTPKSPATAPPA
ncbi:MAG TPA: TMEM43 family protein [Aestuariivirga sp.]|nr:TMEM43 family protein [Alphaproteobacteria bacterium]HRX36178.1 TMEM43 family protein [Aestuariivirga sp.]